MVAIGVQATGPDLTEATTEVSFQKAFLAVTNIVFAYSMFPCPTTRFSRSRSFQVTNSGLVAHVAFFGYMSEMDEPRDFPKSLALLQVVDTCMYVVTAVVIYRYAGPDVASPALSSAGPIMKKVTYGLAIPTVGLLSHLHSQLLITWPPGNFLRCCSGPCRWQIYLCPTLPRLGCHAPAQLCLHWSLGGNWSNIMG
jgi:hypothetical protein